MINTFSKLPKVYQGILYILTGTIALLYALGIIEKGITILVIGLALYAIIIGCTKLGLLQNISHYSAKIKNLTTKK